MLLACGHVRLPESHCGMHVSSLQPSLPHRSSMPYDHHNYDYDHDHNDNHNDEVPGCHPLPHRSSGLLPSQGGSGLLPGPLRRYQWGLFSSSALPVALDRPLMPHPRIRLHVANHSPGVPLRCSLLSSTKMKWVFLWYVHVKMCIFELK